MAANEREQKTLAHISECLLLSDFFFQPFNRGQAFFCGFPIFDETVIRLNQPFVKFPHSDHALADKAQPGFLFFISLREFFKYHAQMPFGHAQIVFVEPHQICAGLLKHVAGDLIEMLAIAAHPHAANKLELLQPFGDLIDRRFAHVQQFANLIFGDGLAQAQEQAYYSAHQIAVPEFHVTVAEIFDDVFVQFVHGFFY